MRDDRGEAMLLRASHDGYAQRYGVIHQRTSEPVQGGLRIVLPQRDNVPILLLNTDPARNRGIQFALGPLHRDQIAFNFDRHALGQCDRLFSNS